MSDADGDGRTDILLDHMASGGFAYWQMQGAGVVQLSPNLGSPAGYQRAATSDFNGDGRADVAWVNPGTQHVLFWLADGAGGRTFPLYARGEPAFGWPDGLPVRSGTARPR